MLDVNCESKPADVKNTNHRQKVTKRRALTVVLLGKGTGCLRNIGRRYQLDEKIKMSFQNDLYDLSTYLTLGFRQNRKWCRINITMKVRVFTDTYRLMKRLFRNRDVHWAFLFLTMILI